MDTINTEFKTLKAIKNALKQHSDIKESHIQGIFCLVMDKLEIDEVTFISHIKNYPNVGKLVCDDSLLENGEQYTKNELNELTLHLEKEFLNEKIRISSMAIEEYFIDLRNQITTNGEIKMDKIITINPLTPLKNEKGDIVAYGLYRNTGRFPITGEKGFDYRLNRKYADRHKNIQELLKNHNMSDTLEIPKDIAFQSSNWKDYKKVDGQLITTKGTDFYLLMVETVEAFNRFKENSIKRQTAKSVDMEAKIAGLNKIEDL